MVVVVVIGLLAAAAVPGYRRITMRSKATATVNDVRAFTASFTAHNMQNGAWPAEEDPQIIPAAIAGSLPAVFARPTPIGGVYDWDHDVSPNGFYTKAAITIVSANGHNMTDDAELVEMIDEMMDDGNLATGNVRLGSANTLVFIIEQ